MVTACTKGGKGLRMEPQKMPKKKLKKDETQVELPVKYPIDDLLVKPSADDPVFSKRPPLSTDFRVPIDSVGDLLMVWDFCLSFGRLLCLSPFSLSDLENAICNKESNLILLVEIHAAFFHLLIKDQSEYFTFVQNKKRTRKVTLVTWADYLGDFLEMMGKEEFSCKLSTVRRGHYGLIDPGLKLKILRELVNEAITTSALREKLDERIDQQQALAAAKREDARKNREEQRLNMEGVSENGINHTSAAQNGNENVKDQHEGKEQKGLEQFFFKQDERWENVSEKTPGNKNGATICTTESSWERQIL
uniref:DDT domain-containing protein n=1 Tax=Arundo donax TaxID=35708 RepID=A0A0A9D810_ARUDO